MRIDKRKLSAVLLCFLLSGCASAIHELASDSAILGSTGVWISVGATPTPATGGMPVPGLHFGYGTVWRIGPHDSVKIIIGGEGGLGAKAQLSIEASNNKDRATIP